MSDTDPVQSLRDTYHEAAAAAGLRWVDGKGDRSTFRGPVDAWQRLMAHLETLPRTTSVTAAKSRVSWVLAGSERDAGAERPKVDRYWSPGQIQDFRKQVLDEYRGFWKHVSIDIRAALVDAMVLTILYNQDRDSIPMEAINQLRTAMHDECGTN